MSAADSDSAAKRVAEALKDHVKEALGSELSGESSINTEDDYCGSDWDRDEYQRKPSWWAIGSQEDRDSWQETLDVERAEYRAKREATWTAKKAEDISRRRAARSDNPTQAEMRRSAKAARRQEQAHKRAACDEQANNEAFMDEELGSDKLIFRSKKLSTK